MSIDQNYSIRFIASLALREKRIQQNYRPIIVVHKWFARRPGTLFRGLLLSKFGKAPVEDIPDEFSPVALIEAKLTEDDSTARDKVSRVQRLGPCVTRPAKRMMSLPALPNGDSR